MREVDDAVRGHIAALLRMVTTFAAMLGDRPAVTRSLRNFVLATLLPVESAARRIVIYAAARIPVIVRDRADRPRPRRFRRFRPAPSRADSSAGGISGPSSPVLPNPAATDPESGAPADSISFDHQGAPLTLYASSLTPRRRRRQFQPRQASRPQGATDPVLPLFDPLRRVGCAGRRKPVAQHAVPRICVPGLTPLRSLPSSGDGLIDPAPLCRRIAAVQAALAGLPSQARRYACWQARRNHVLARQKAAASADKAQPLPSREEMRHFRRRAVPPPEPVRYGRSQPLRAGRPPGARLLRYDPDGRQPPNTREIDEMLAHVNALAWEAVRVASGK